MQVKSRGTVISPLKKSSQLMKNCSIESIMMSKMT